MAHLCREFRDRWLERPPACGLPVPEEGGAPRGGEDLPEAAGGCPACEAWVRRAALLVRALGDLPPRTAPLELERRLFHPDQVATTAEPGEESPAVKAVRALDHFPAPAVLDRLVAEELASPATHRVERFAGDLERLRAPRTLENRVLARMRGGLRARPWVGPVLALAAATVLAWVGAGRLGWRGSPEDVVPVLPGSAYESYSFEVVRPATFEGLHPLARTLAGALDGGSGRSG